MKQNYEIFLQWFKRLADLGGYYSRVGLPTKASVFTTSCKALHELVLWSFFCPVIL